MPRWVAQGGFAGDSIVPPEDRLPKFAGTTTQESYNFGHDAKAALLALSSPRVRERLLVAKNVTHGVAWDPAVQARLKGRDDLTAGARLAVEAMDVYLRERPEGSSCTTRLPRPPRSIGRPSRGLRWRCSGSMAGGGHGGQVPRVRV